MFNHEFEEYAVLAFSLASVRRNKSLQEQAYHALRTSIKVSRTPIREAIRQLQRDTLVTADDRGNLRVTTISADDVVQLYDCRMALERLSVEGACQHATRHQLQAMAELVSKAEEAVSQQHSFSMLELDYQFHHHIAECSGNPWLVGLLDQVFDKMTLLRTQTTRLDPQVLEIRCEHRFIYEAIARGTRSAPKESEAAVAAIETHLIASKARVVEAVKRIAQG
jgi:DNA-binding GntR family transcriptional regulator